MAVQQTPSRCLTPGILLGAGGLLVLYVRRRQCCLAVHQEMYTNSNITVFHNGQLLPSSPHIHLVALWQVLLQL